jgi:hypothetical protein
MAALASGADREVKRQAAKEMLEQFCTAEDVTRWTATRRFLHTFSFRNQLLLMLQLADRGLDHREAYPVQAAWRWKKADYHPAKRAKALWAQAPHRKAKEKDGTWLCACGKQAAGPRCPDGDPRRTVFVFKPVSAACDVVGFHTKDRPPLPPAPAPLDGSSHGQLWGPLVLWGANELGTRTALRTPEEDALLGDAGGYYNRREKRDRGPP